MKAKPSKVWPRILENENGGKFVFVRQALDGSAIYKCAHSGVSVNYQLMTQEQLASTYDATAQPHDHYIGNGNT